jgi:hypothetical protein
MEDTVSKTAEKGITYSIPITVKLTEKDLADVFSCAIEGGSNYWYRLESSVKGYAEDGKLVDYLRKGITVSNFHIGDEDEYTQRTVYFITLAEAITKLSTLRPDMVKRIVEGQYDANDADVVLQIAVLGEEKYG